MIVECPRCRARYRVESDLLDQDQTFKCSRCGHIFAYEKGGTGASAETPAEAASPQDTPPAIEVPPPPPAATPVAAPPEPVKPEPVKEEPKKPAPRRELESSLSFQFERPAASPPEPVKEPEPSRAAPVIHSRDEEEEAESDAELDDFTFDDEDASPTRAAAPPPPPARRRSVSNEPRFVRGDDDIHEEEDDSGNAGRPYLFFLGGLVAVYALFAFNLLNHPAQAEKLLASVPMVGDMLAEDHLLQVRVQLQDVEGAYQQIKDDRMVFIVSGRAVNTSAEALKGVQIESTLYDGAGQPIETKSIYTGNAMSLKIVKDLSSKEISLLQRLEPPKRFEIRPGESAGFSVVFVSPPAGAKEFTARVVAAQSSAI